MGHLTSSGPLVKYVCSLLSFNLEIMVFITCSQCMILLLFTKQATFTPFAMHGIVSKVSNNAILIQTMLY